VRERIREKIEAAPPKVPPPPKRSGPGRPKVEVTEEQRQKVRALSAAGVPQKMIARIVKVSDKTLAKKFSDELAITQSEITGIAMGKLLTKIQAGDLGAICFWMKCKAGWMERRAIEHTGADGAPLKLTEMRQTLMLALGDYPPEERLKIAEKLMIAGKADATVG